MATFSFLEKKGSNFVLPESPISPRTNAVAFYYSHIAPPSYHVDMDMEEAGNLCHCQRGVRLV